MFGLPSGDTSINDNSFFCYAMASIMNFGMRKPSIIPRKLHEIMTTALPTGRAVVIRLFGKIGMLLWGAVCCDSMK